MGKSRPRELSDDWATTITVFPHFENDSTTYSTPSTNRHRQAVAHPTITLPTHSQAPLNLRRGGLLREGSPLHLRPVGTRGPFPWRKFMISPNIMTLIYDFRNLLILFVLFRTSNILRPINLMKCFCRCFFLWLPRKRKERIRYRLSNFMRREHSLIHVWIHLTTHCARVGGKKCTTIHNPAEERRGKNKEEDNGEKTTVESIWQDAHRLISTPCFLQPKSVAVAFALEFIK